MPGSARRVSQAGAGEGGFVLEFAEKPAGGGGEVAWAGGVGADAVAARGRCDGGGLAGGEAGHGGADEARRRG
jgi:hypothetical protein